MNPKALKMIEDALFPLIRNGRKIERIRLFVCPSSPISEEHWILTRYGKLRVHPDDMTKKGLAFLLEEPGRCGRGFAWVSRPDKEDKHGGGKKTGTNHT